MQNFVVTNILLHFQMKRSTILYIVSALASMLILSCRQTDPTAAEATVSIQETAVDLTSIAFSITTENATDAAYLVYNTAAEENVPESGYIFSNGTRIPTDQPSEITVSDLDPNTSYTVAAVAKNSAGIASEVTTLTISTTPSDGLYSFEATVSNITDVSADVRVQPSSEEAYYVLDRVSADTYADMSQEEIHAEYLRIFNGIAYNENRTLEEVLAENLVNGSFTGTFEELTPQTDYNLVVFGMDPVKGFLTSDVQLIPFTTAEQVLTLTVMVENITSKSADVYVYPSNDNDTFVWLCEQTAKYPDMSLEEIAQAYTEANSMWLDMYMGLYTGAQEYPGYELMPGVDYYILAYGYEPGVGISTEVVGQFFTSLEGGNIEDFDATIDITKLQGERIDYTVTPNDETVYYLPGCMKTSEYSDQFVKEDVQTYIKEYWEANTVYNPTFSIQEAVDILCYTGTNALYASPLEPMTDYTVFVVPVNSKGETGSVVISKQGTTPDMGYSDADATSEYMGAWDGAMLQEAGYFQNEDLTDKYIMAFKINVSPTCDTVKIKNWNGLTDMTDQELIDIIVPYWDAVYAGDDLDNLKYVYTTTPSYWPGAITFCTLGFNAEGVRAAMGRTYVENFWEDALLSLEEWEALQADGNASSPAAISPNNMKSEKATDSGRSGIMLFPKNNELQNN